MTNKEAIKSMRNLDDVISITASEHESVKTAISALEHNSLLIERISNLQNENTDFFNKLVESEQENEKLKAEIENSNRIISNMIDEHECGIVGRNVEIINLKSEIEQLKSTISKMETITAHEEDLK